MSLINCPECGHDISNAAVACPNCGRPLQIRTVSPARPVVVDRTERETGIPPWAFVAMGVAAVLVLFFVIAMINRDADDSANANLRVRMDEERRSASTRDTSAPVDPSTADGPQISGSNVPATTSESTVPGSQTAINSAPDKGLVKIDAKIVSNSGTPQAVKNEKFYLLEKDVEMILSDAGLDPIEGNTLSNSLGLSIAFPDRYGEFRRKALDAINKHIEYSGTTDSTGKAELRGVDPGSYYLFGMTKTGEGFAIWSSPVSVIAGENVLNLAPQRLNEIQEHSE